MSTNTSYQTNEVTGYTTKHSLSIAIFNLDKLGNIFDEVIKAGATKVDNFTYIVKDRTALEEAAMQQAMQDARRKAAVLAGVPVDALSVVKITNLATNTMKVGAGWFSTEVESKYRHMSCYIQSQLRRPCVWSLASSKGSAEGFSASYP